MFITTPRSRRPARPDRPHAPFPLIWSPRSYGASFGLSGPGGAG